MRETVISAIQGNVPIPTIVSALEYLDLLGTDNGSGRIIQAMRGFFGAHGVTLIGKKDETHIDWDQ